MQKTKPKSMEKLLLELEKEHGSEFFRNLNMLDKSHMTKEELEEDIDKHIQKSLEQIKNGEYVTTEELFKKWDDFFGV